MVYSQVFLKIWDDRTVSNKTDTILNSILNLIKPALVAGKIELAEQAQQIIGGIVHLLIEHIPEGTYGVWVEVKCLNLDRTRPLIWSSIEVHLYSSMSQRCPSRRSPLSKSNL